MFLVSFDVSLNFTAPRPHPTAHAQGLEHERAQMASAFHLTDLLKQELQEVKAQQERLSYTVSEHTEAVSEVAARAAAEEHEDIKLKQEISQLKETNRALNASEQIALAEVRQQQLAIAQVCTKPRFSRFSIWISVDLSAVWPYFPHRYSSFTSQTRVPQLHALSCVQITPQITHLQTKTSVLYTPAIAQLRADERETRQE